MTSRLVVFCVFFNDTATTEIYTLSLHDALPISLWMPRHGHCGHRKHSRQKATDRKSTRLNSSHGSISYAVFCLKTKTTISHALHLDLLKPTIAATSAVPAPS